MARGDRTRIRIRIAITAVSVAGATMLSGCGLQIPVDPDGTLDRITGGVLRVGASPAGELVRVSGRDVSGSLPELVEGFADARDARVEWTIGSEEDLVDDLAAGDLDLAVGGMTDATPWVDAVSVTRGYPGVEGSGGASVVVLMPMGENALQAALERYLDTEVGG